MTMPLLVYLDSSDFSCLSAANVPAEIQQVRNDLEEWRAAGTIAVVFSNVHVAEACAVTRDAVPSSNARLRAIHALCWPHAMLNLTDLLSDEIDRLYALSEGSSVLRHDGNWLPREIFDVQFPTLVEMIEEIVAEAPTPEMRDRVSRRFFTSAGQLRSAALKEVLRRIPRFIEALRHRLPITESVESAIWQHFRKHTADPSALMRELAVQLQDLRNFAEWQQRDWGSVLPIAQWLRETGRNAAEHWSQIAREVVAKAAENRSLGISDDEFAAIGRDAMRTWAETAVPRMAQRLTSRAAPPVIADVANIAKYAPSLYAAVRIQSAMAWHSIRPTLAPRKPRPSDFGDISHTLYLPHVDVFRADRFTASVIRSCLPDLGERVVDDWRMLPGVIRDRITNEPGWAS